MGGTLSGAHWSLDSHFWPTGPGDPEVFVVSFVHLAKGVGL